MQRPLISVTNYEWLLLFLTYPCGIFSVESQRRFPLSFYAWWLYIWCRITKATLMLHGESKLSAAGAEKSSHRRSLLFHRQAIEVMRWHPYSAS